MSEEANWGNPSGLPGMTLDDTRGRPENGRLLVSFRKVQVKQEFESKRRGVPVYKEIDHIVIQNPGDSQKLDIPVTDVYKERFPDEWARWERHQENKIIGFPIDHWPQLNETQKAEFKAMAIHTVEQLADLSDSVAQKIRGYQELKKRALAFLEAGKDAEANAKQKADADAREEKLRAEIAELRALIEGKTAPEKTKAS